METNDTYLYDLITRYLTGEASPEEIRELSARIGSDPALAEEFRELQRAWQLSVNQLVNERIDTDQEWKSLQRKLFQPEKTISPKPGRPGKLTSDRITEISETPPVRKFPTPPKHPAKENPPRKRNTPDGRVVPLREGKRDWRVTLIRFATIAAILLVLLIPAWMAYNYFSKPVMIRVAASEGMMETQLPDGTTVTLNAYATLAYAKGFGISHREVELSGEAYFEVHRDSTLPFIISNDQARIEVLGTSFYVDAQAISGDVQVVLVEGRVTVYFDQFRAGGKTLIPGEKAGMVQANQQIVVSANVNPNFLAWKTKRLVFIDDRLDDVIHTLNSVYQANLALSSDRLKNCRITATFNRQTLPSVLSVI